MSVFAGPKRRFACHPLKSKPSFLQQLAEDLNSKNIKLPSFPDVVINIRTALEDPTCSSERLADVVRTDAVLVARLLMAANSAFHNRAGIEIVDLNLAISRLGFEVVRNTAITLAVEQIFNASQHEDLRESFKNIWSGSLSLASMCFVIARQSDNLNPDNAFLCGLLHEVGKLYILTKAREFPNLMGDPDSLADRAGSMVCECRQVDCRSLGLFGRDRQLPGDRGRTSAATAVRRPPSSMSSTRRGWCLKPTTNRNWMRRHRISSASSRSVKIRCLACAKHTTSMRSRCELRSANAPNNRQSRCRHCLQRDVSCHFQGSVDPGRTQLRLD